MKKHLKNFLNGMAFGATETVPGVSGGTIAIILGFYDDLIRTINNFRKDKKNALRFLLPIAAGVAVGVLTLGYIINLMLEKYSFPTMSFFVGLIIGIIPLIFLKIKKPGKGLELNKIILIVVPMAFLFGITFLGELNFGDEASFIATMDVWFMLFIFVSGIVAAAALVIPGVSGSFVLLLIGIYPLATHCVSAIKDYISDIGNTALLVDICKVLVPLALGVAVGGITMVKLIERLLEKHHDTVYSVILGLLVGSVYVIFNNPIVTKSGMASDFIYVIAAGTLILGAVTSFFIGKKKL